MSAGARSTTITYGNMKFLICIMPNLFYMRHYIEDLQRYGVRTLVKTCDCSYSLHPFDNAGIDVLELVFPNGQFPSKTVIEDWLAIVKDHFLKHPKTALAVHCRCGLGRSAVLVAIALMESGVSPFDVVEFIQTARRGTFNDLQYDRIWQYKPGNRLSFVDEPDDDPKKSQSVKLVFFDAYTNWIKNA
ncbi:hypothetical protein FQR65_LT02729 [Abscondita terminalis]|nr:hypothetical protein FQR65_LT02729 [Abscondita terminalis]